MKEGLINILTLSEDPKLKRRVKSLYPKDKAYVIWESNFPELIDHLKTNVFDIFILTSEVCSKQEYDWVDLLEQISRKSPATQVLMLVSPEDLDLAVQALEAGAYHYIKMPVSDEEMKMVIDVSLKDRPAHEDKLLIRDLKEKDRLGQLIGSSGKMQQVFRLIKQAAASDIHILLLGETGTGKDLVAKTIHELSERRDGPFIPVNLGSLPLELVSSELFGHEKGSFTGAVDKRVGVFEQADDGTVFLDEIDTIDEKSKVALLRLIEQKEFSRLGGKRKIKSNARLIAASNADLEKMSDDGSFRKDLFYRLDAFRINLPPLRERDGDLRILTEDYVLRYSKSFSKKINSISTDFFELLESYDWPGNIRELKNVVQRSVLMCNDRELGLAHLPPKFKKVEKKPRSISFELGTTLDDIEKEMVIRALKATNNNRKKAAELLGISRRVIYNKLKKHNIE